MFGFQFGAFGHFLHDLTKFVAIAFVAQKINYYNFENTFENSSIDLCKSN